VPGLSAVATGLMELTVSDVILLACSYMHDVHHAYRHVSLIGRAGALPGEWLNTRNAVEIQRRIDKGRKAG
jgi:hypothetical protein